MTLDELKAKQAADMSTNAWLREVCIQLAMLNESKAFELRKPLKPTAQKVN